MLSKIAICVGLTFICVTVFAVETQDYLIPDGSIPLNGVEGRLDHLSADVKSQRVFASALENYSIEVLDLVTKKRIHQISGIREPQGLVFLPESKRLLVCSRGDGTCRSFDADTFEEGAWVDLGLDADNVRLDNKAQTVYVGSGDEPGPGSMTAIDVAAFIPAKNGGKPAPPKSKNDLLSDPNRPRQSEPKASVALDSHPESFQVDEEKHRIYANVPDNHQIAVVDVKPDGLKVGAVWPVEGAEKNFAMALDRVAGRLYVVCRVPAMVLVYDVNAGKVVSRTPCVGDSDDVFFDSEKHRLYVIGGDGIVDIFDTVAKDGALEKLARITTAPKARTGLFLAELHLLIVLAPHLSDKLARVLLFRVKP